MPKVVLKHIDILIPNFNIINYVDVFCISICYYPLVDDMRLI